VNGDEIEIVIARVAKATIADSSEPFAADLLVGDSTASV
jgi:hypothetical protein